LILFSQSAHILEQSSDTQDENFEDLPSNHLRKFHHSLSYFEAHILILSFTRFCQKKSEADFIILSENEALNL